MKYSYYPGCTLKNKAKDLDEYARASAKALGFEMEEIKDGKKTGRKCSKRIVYMMENFEGLENGYCILGCELL